MKTNIVLVGLMMAAGSGLVSCSPDTDQKPDQLKISEPAIVRSEGAVGWNDFTLQEKRELDIYDLIQFKNVPDVTLTASTQCQKGEQKFSTTRSFALTAETAVDMLLSDEMLLMVSEKRPLTCSIHFVARNGTGSQHIFDLQSVSIVEKIKSSSIRLLNKNTQALMGSVVFGDENAQVAVANTDYQKIALRCSETQAESENIGGKFSLAKFQIGNEHFQTYGQRCRIFSYNNNSRVGISNSFIYIIDLPKLDLRIHDADWYNAQNTNADFLKSPHTSVQVTNDLARNLLLVIPKKAPEFKYVFASTKDHKHKSFWQTTLVNPGLVAVSDYTGASLIEQETEFQVTLKPGEQISIHIGVSPKQRNCLYGDIKELWSDQLYEIFVREDMDGEVADVEALTISFKEKLKGASRFFEPGVGFAPSNPERFCLP